jgi:hypothetical protein
MHGLSLFNNAATIIINNIWFALSILLLRLSLFVKYVLVYIQLRAIGLKDVLISPQLD